MSEALAAAASRGEIHADESGWFHFDADREHATAEWAPTPDDESLRFAYESLVDALCLAALPAEEQLASLPDFVAAEDEVALVFDDAYVLVPQVAEAGLIGDDVVASLGVLDGLLDRAARSSMWAPGALAADPQWAMVRRSARQALDTMHEPLRQPVFEGTRWLQ